MEFDKIGFDIACAVDPSLHGSFDLIVSRMVMQHVDARRAWTKVANLLAPGGVALAFHPVFTAPPWARSELCTCNPAIVEPALRAVGFRETLSAPLLARPGRRLHRRRRARRVRRGARLALACEFSLYARAKIAAPHSAAAAACSRAAGASLPDTAAPASVARRAKTSTDRLEMIATSTKAIDRSRDASVWSPRPIWIA